VSRTTVGTSVWNPGAVEPKHGDYRPGSFRVLSQAGDGLWRGLGCSEAPEGSRGARGDRGL
jgi:hypothetical protein